MRKSLLLLCLLLALTLCLSACGSHKLTLTITDKNRFAIDTKLSAPLLQMEYTKDGYGVGIYYLGRVGNVPLAYSQSVAHKQMSFESLTFDESNFSESIFTTAKNNALSEVVSTAIEGQVALKDANGKEAMVNLVSVLTVDYRYNVKEALKDGNAPSSGYSFIDSYAYVSEFVSEKRLNLQDKIGIFDTDCYGRISLFGSCDVYAFAVYNGVSNTLSVSYDLSVVENSLAFGSDRSAEEGFHAKEGAKEALMLQTSVLQGSSILNNLQQYAVSYVLNGGAFENPPVNTYTLANTNLSTPSLQYFDFGGWYFDSQLTEPATPEALRQRAADVMVYAKWNTQTDESHFEGFTGLTSNIKGQETGRVNTVLVDQNKLQAYIEAGYHAKITYYYTYGVPTEYEGTADSSDLKVEIGFSTDVNGSNFILYTVNTHDAVAPGHSGSSSLSFEADLGYLMQYRVTARTVILSNDTDVLGICGKDAGTYSHLKMVIEYVK